MVTHRRLNTDRVRSTGRKSGSAAHYLKVYIAEGCPITAYKGGPLSLFARNRVFTMQRRSTMLLPFGLHQIFIKYLKVSSLALSGFIAVQRIHVGVQTVHRLKEEYY